MLLGLPGCDKIQQVLKTEEAAPVASGSEITADEFEAFKSTPNKVVVVDFYADWCGPCKTLGPKLEKVTAEFGERVILGKVNVDEAKSMATRLGVSGIPDVRIFSNGVEVDRIIGDGPEDELRKRIQAAVNALPAAVDEPPAAGPSQEPSEPVLKPMDKDWMPEGMYKR